MKQVMFLLLIFFIPYYALADGGWTGDKVRAATNNEWVVSTSPPTVYAGDWVEGEIWLWYQTDPGIGAQFVYTTDNWNTSLYDLFVRGITNGNDARFSNEGSSIGPWVAGTVVKYKMQCWHEWINPDFFTTEASFTVSALSNPTLPTATTQSSSQINLSWSLWNSKNVMIVRKKSTESWTEPTQGTSYTAGNYIGSGIVVYNSNGTSYLNTGLLPATGYDYKFYSENFSYYSPGITASATTLTSSSTDYFRSKTTGNWSTIAAWESSPDHTNWVTANLVPTAFANSVTILNRHTITLDADASVPNLTINSGGIVNISPGKSLTVTVNLTNSADNSGLVIADGGTLITNGSVSGGATVSRAISGPRWHQMSAPVTSQSIFTDFTDMYAYDEVSNFWLNKTVGTFPDATYLPGKGYLASWEATTTTKEFAGTLNSGDYTTGAGSVPALTYTVGKGNGYNLLGNPYPSALTGSISSWTKTNVDASIWVFDNGNYLTWNGITGTLTNGIIPAMQGFWVKANASGASLTIPNTARTTSSQAYYKSSQTLQDVILLNVAGNGYNDGIVVNFNNQASSGYDGDFDVRKMMGDDAAPQLYCLASGEKLSIDVLPYSTKEVVVPVNLKVGKDENYTISVKENTFVPTVSILLEDTKTSQTTNLQTQSNYSFSAAVTDSPDRFRLHFGGALGIKDNAQNNPIRIYSANNSIYVANTTGNMIKGKLFVYNLMGQQLMQQELGSGALTKVNLNCSTGYYLVKVVTSDNAYSGKVFLQ